MTFYDTVIIGGGLAGLTAALLLREQGQQVAVFEKSVHLGGRAYTRDQDGFYLNMGPHALYRGGAGLPILKKLGLQPQGHKPLFGQRPQALTPTGRQLLPVTPGLIFKSELLHHHRWAYLKTLAIILSHRPSERLNRTAWQSWLEKRTSPGSLRELLAALGRLATYANDPQRMSAGATLAQIKKALTSNVLYLDQGWGQLVSALADRAVQAGIPLVTQKRATTVDRRGDGSLSVVFSDAERVSTRQVVLAIPPQAAVELLPGSPALATAVDRLNPIRAACLTVGLSRLPDPAVQIGLGVGLSYYNVVHSKSARLAPKGAALVHTAAYIAPDDRRSPNEHRQFLEGALDQLQPGWREKVLVCDFLPRMTVSHALVEASGPRPPLAVPDLPGIYVIGDWVEAGAMLADNSLASAAKVAKMIISDE